MHNNPTRHQDLRGLLSVLPRIVDPVPYDHLLIVTYTPRNTVGLVLRIDRDDMTDKRTRTRLVKAIRENLQSTHTQRIVLASYTRDNVRDGDPVLDKITPAFQSAVPDVDQVAVRFGRYFTPRCVDPTCCPPNGRPLPIGSRGEAPAEYDETPLATPRLESAYRISA